jgi:fructose-specific phosphotransferase system IIC component
MLQPLYPAQQRSLLPFLVLGATLIDWVNMIGSYNSSTSAQSVSIPTMIRHYGVIGKFSLHVMLMALAMVLE